MSGFVGIISAGGAPPDRPLLERMAAALAFRGPDATHITTQPGAGFVFTFLRTGPTPQFPQQPVTLDNRLWLIGDVRLDGREDLRRKLEQHGASISRTATDEELILHAYQKWGEQSFPDLIGDYAVALWDSIARRLLCLRDLIGSRPFFYAHVSGQLIFSNTLNAIRFAPKVSAELDRHFIADFLLQESCPDLARTAFQDISRLPPSHLLSYSRDNLGVRRFTSLPIEEPLVFKRQEEYVEQFRALFETAVRDRLPHHESAIFLSGGMDSTSIAATAVACVTKSHSPIRLYAFAVNSCPLLDDPEAPLASLVAGSLGIPIQTVSFAKSPPCEGWGARALHVPEPYSDPFLLSQRKLHQQVAARSRVAWWGFGGDELLSGQSWPYLVYLLRRARFLEIAGSFGIYLLKHRRIPLLRGGFRARFLRWTGRAPRANDCPRWIQPRFAEQHHLRQRWVELQQPPKFLEHPFQPRAHGGLDNGIWASALEYQDASWTRSPYFVSHTVPGPTATTLSIAYSAVPWCAEKHILREAFRDELPEQIRTRRKTPLVCDPLLLWATKRRWRPSPLSNPAHQISDFVDWDEVRSALRADSPSSFLLVYGLICVRSL